MADEFAKDILRVVNLARSKAEPRVIAIVIAAYVENYLTGLLKKKMPGLTSGLSAKIFRPSEGALGGLARKIDMAKALEALTPHYAREAVLIARIRNRFAHHLDVDTFDHPKVADLVDSLTVKSRGKIRKGDKFVELYPGNSRAARFTDAGVSLCAFIMENHVEQHPYVFRLEEADWPDGVRPPWHEIQVPGPQPRPKGRDPKDQ